MLNLFSVTKRGLKGYITIPDSPMTEKEPQYMRDTALILKERGMQGVEIILTTTECPDTLEGIESVLADPKNIVGGYVVKPEYIPHIIAELLAFKAKHEAYKYCLRVFSGCENPDVLDDVTNKHLDFQDSCFVAPSQTPSDMYYIGGDLVLFTKEDSDNTAASLEIKRHWESTFGELHLWGIIREPVGEKMYFGAKLRSSAYKFYQWFYHEYIKPKLVEIQATN